MVSATTSLLRVAMNQMRRMITTAAAMMAAIAPVDKGIKTTPLHNLDLLYYMTYDFATVYRDKVRKNMSVRRRELQFQLAPAQQLGQLEYEYLRFGVGKLAVHDHIYSGCQRDILHLKKLILVRVLLTYGLDAAHI